MRVLFLYKISQDYDQSYEMIQEAIVCAGSNEDK